MDFLVFWQDFYIIVKLFFFVQPFICATFFFLQNFILQNFFYFSKIFFILAIFSLFL